VPLVFAAAVAAAPPARAKGIALLGTMVALILAAFALAQFDWGFGGQLQMVWSLALLDSENAPHGWLDPLGVNLSVGADAVSMLLVGLTALLGPICVAASSTAITERLRTYYSWLLVLQAAMTGVFIARDLVLFYICFEFTLVPMYVLISLYGSTNRRAAAIKFFLYTFTGSMIALAGLVYVAYHHYAVRGAWTFDISALEMSARALSATEQGWVLLALMAGFAVKVPLFPLHTWLPLAHTEAPTAGSVILAGVLLKLGTYGLYRFAIPFAPLAVIEHTPLIAALCIVGILYGGLICWVQRDVKKLVAYSSVAHLGFCVLGLFALNNTGVQGSVLYMINHGLSTGALFLCIGMMYERYHTRSMDEVGGLAARMPVWSTFMVFFTMASVGLPGLNGFVSEFLCLLGAFQAGPAWGAASGVEAGQTLGRLGPWYAFIAGLGMIVAAMYLLIMLGKVVWGPLREPGGHNGHGHGHAAPAHGEGAHGAVLPPDLTAREVTILLPLAALCLWLGVYPKPVMDGINKSTTMLVERVWEADRQQRIGRQDAAAALPGHGGSPTVEASRVGVAK
jgi:NADH-quinone oxidoreductase subunit M